MDNPPARARPPVLSAPPARNPAAILPIDPLRKSPFTERLPRNDSCVGVDLQLPPKIRSEARNVDPSTSQGPPIDKEEPNRPSPRELKIVPNRASAVAERGPAMSQRPRTLRELLNFAGPITSIVLQNCAAPLSVILDAQLASPDAWIRPPALRRLVTERPPPIAESLETVSRSPSIVLPKTDQVERPIIVPSADTLDPKYPPDETDATEDRQVLPEIESALAVSGEPSIDAPFSRYTGP